MAYALKDRVVFSGHDLKTPNAVKHIGAFFSDLLGLSEEKRVFNQTVKELQRLNDRELADIGITRCDIYAIARQAAELKHAHLQH